jgi:3-hydroxyisobutyrate dehydrogenase-like beta-hydroxyacid dehydrogenase
MAGHILAAGHEVSVWNRTPGRTNELVDAGATAAATPAAAATGADMVVLVLFGPESVSEVLNGPDGVLAGLPSGSLVVDTTTIGPADARRFAEVVASAGGRYVDAPLIGSIGPATAGTLGSFVGGSDADFTKALSLLNCWCDPTAVVHAGPVGSGAAVKIVRNLGHAVAVAGLGEALRLAADLEMDRDLALSALGAGPLSWTIAATGSALADRDYTDAEFTAALLAKDAALAAAAADRPMPLVSLAQAWANTACAAGAAQQHYLAVADFIESTNGRPGD